MAKKEAPPESDSADEAQGEDAKAAAGAKGLLGKLRNKKVLMIAVPALLLVLGGGGAGAYFLLFNGHDDKVKLAKADELPLTPPEVAFEDMPDILVNIQSNDGTPAYLKLSVALEMDTVAQKAGLDALKPRLVDQFQAYLRELRIDDLKGSAGVLRLKEELLRRVNVAAAPYKVRDVLLKEMIVQ